MSAIYYSEWIILTGNGSLDLTPCFGYTCCKRQQVDGVTGCQSWCCIILGLG